jgi:prepilin-type N-terminal cleavage/methylation domain-containing protein
MVSSMTPSCSPLQAPGYTLVEALVVTAILGVVLAMTTTVMSLSSQTFTREKTIVSLQQDLAAAKTIFLDDVSIAGYLKTPTTTFPSGGVTTGTLSSIRFEGDVDSDGTADRLCYQVSGGVLQRKKIASGADCSSTGTWENLVGGVTAFTVTFLNSSRTTLTDAQVIAGTSPGPARYVDVLLTIQAAAGGTTVAKSIYGEAALRN